MYTASVVFDYYWTESELVLAYEHTVLQIKNSTDIIY